MSKFSWKEVMTTNVVIAALGYFVDIYDLVLFSIVRIASLKGIGVPESEFMSAGIYLLNMQMIGMLLGGLIWGVLGDKRGRVSVLFGSILMYSLANIANAFVTNVETYAWLRFIAGIGLAGELGAAVTLVAETLPKHLRGYGTAIVAGVGVSGAALAGIIGEIFPWQAAYIIGGVLGLLLLFARIKMFDSKMFSKTLATTVRRGDLLMLFQSRERFFRYLNCILIGIPLWFVVGILGTFSPEICRELGATGPILSGRAIMCIYMGLVVGDIGSGFISQWLKSRKRVVLYFLIATGVLSSTFVLLKEQDPVVYYSLFFLIGIAAGYWAMFVTIAAEQFGTNMRATVATTVPNFVRGSVVALTWSFNFLGPTVGKANSALLVGIVCCIIAYAGLRPLRETFDTDLDFHE
jgi:putative MFS transporter